MSDYWGITVSEAFEDAGISATKEQLDTVIAWVEGSHENYGQAHGHDVGRPSMILESEHRTQIRGLQREAEEEAVSRDRREDQLRWRIRELESTVSRLRDELRALT